MKDGLCPKCGERTVYLRKNKQATYGMGSVPLGGLLNSLNAPTDDYACVTCGYVEVYITDPTRLDYIAENWQHVADSAAPGDTRRLPPLG